LANITRWGHIRHVAAVADARAIPVLLDLLSSPDQNVFEQAVLALGKMVRVKLIRKEDPGINLSVLTNALPRLLKLVNYTAPPGLEMFNWAVGKELFARPSLG